MISNVRLRKQFWEEVVNTSMYLINRGPSSQLDFEALEEKWLDKNIFIII